MSLRKPRTVADSGLHDRTGLNLSPAQSMGFHQQQQQQQAQNLLNPGRHGIGIGNIGGMGMGGFGGGMNLGMGIGLSECDDARDEHELTCLAPADGMPSPRRSPRAPDRSPGGFNNKGPSTAVAPGSGANPDEPLDMALLGDVSQWLRSLRLHKYTPNFETSNWKEMIMLDDTGLQDKGVSALGARRKLLKCVRVPSCLFRISSMLIRSMLTLLLVQSL